MPVDAVGDADYVVRVVAGDVTCSGTLIQEDQVLTAHHCVAERNRYGEAMRSDVEPDRILVELGGDYLPWGEVGVRAVVAPPCGYSAGDGDIAVLVLERRLVGIATLALRLDRAPQLGETVEPVGFGRCPLSADGIRRRARLGGAVATVKAGRFRLPASICPGDSGGPAISRRGELVGVISKSIMDGSERTVGQSEFTRVDRWRSVFATARLVAEGIPPTEIPPLACSER
jgi:secreted trypsin-like serine protease